MTELSDEMTLLGVIDLIEAKRLRSALEDRGVRLELVSNPATCASGKCGARVEVYARPEDIPAFKEYVGNERARVLDGLDVPGHTDAVFDPEQGQATCPACGTGFATTLTECPDCGLSFSADVESHED